MKLLCTIMLVLCLTGCAGPLLLGLKEYRSPSGATYKFITGADFSIGANGIDSVNNNRGINKK